MAVESLKTKIIDKGSNAKATAGAKIKNVDGSTFTKFLIQHLIEIVQKAHKKLIQSTGYFGTKVS